MEQYSPRINPKFAAFAHCQYYPVIDDGILELTRKHSWKHLPLVCADAPGQPYGSALRIGYTGTQEMDLAIYRLKLRGTGDRAFMLPFLYVLQDGVFIPYEH